MFLTCGVGEDSSFLQIQLLLAVGSARRSKQSIQEISPEYSLEGLMLKLKLQYLATWCEELSHWKRPWCWGRLKVGGEGDDRGWDGWMASSTQWTWVWASSESWWWTGKPGVLQRITKSRTSTKSNKKGQTWLSDWTELGRPLMDSTILVAFNLVKFMSECIQWCAQGSSRGSCDSKSRVLPIKPSFHDTGPSDGGILSADEKGDCWVSRLRGCCFSKISLGAWNETHGFVLQLLWWWLSR